ncbi:hypothetical protein [Roseibium sediminis]|uniref:hypothetical protein n=1 Tax=Roseibium sediminis TaxID=1775174 RepID=UPI00123CCF62|nr:hypothetical protein [Roseibium sediminis]
MLLLLSMAFFAVFLVNVTIGSFGGSPFLGSVGEMILLFATSIAFVVAVLKKEEDEHEASN